LEAGHCESTTTEARPTVAGAKAAMARVRRDRPGEADAVIVAETVGTAAAEASHPAGRADTTARETRDPAAIRQEEAEEESRPDAARPATRGKVAGGDLLD